MVLIRSASISYFSTKTCATFSWRNMKISILFGCKKHLIWSYMYIMELHTCGQCLARSALLSDILITWNGKEKHVKSLLHRYEKLNFIHKGDFAYTETWKMHIWAQLFKTNDAVCVCVEALRPSQPDGVMSSAVSLPNHTFTGQA